jgi:hypothetical protein
MNTDELDMAIERQGLPSFLAEVLGQLALDGDGLDAGAAPSFVASLMNRPLEECNDAIIELLGRNLLLLRVVDAPNARLVANYQILGIGEETRLRLTRRATPFEALGAPHSPNSMSTLDAIFREERDPIYLGLEVTSHKVFRELQARAEAGRVTVFLIPKRQHLPSERTVHYDEMRSAWVRWLGEGRRALRKNIRILVTPRPLPHLYTSCLTRNVARLDLYHYGQNTTRRGEMIQAPRGSSLYDLAYRQIREAVNTSVPLPSVWPVEWAGFFLRRTWLAIAGLGAAGGLSWFGRWPFLATLLLGIGTNAVFEWFRSVRWPPTELYRRS